MDPKSPNENAALNPSPPKRTRLPRAERELQILRVALELFISKGYQGTSMEHIAESAGVSRPIVYNLFGSKDAVYLACLRNARQQLDQRLVEAGSATSYANGQALLRAGIDGYFHFVEQDRAAWRLLFGGGAAVAGAVVGEAQLLRFDTVAKITALLTPLMPKAKHAAVEMQAHALSGAAEQLAKWWIENEHVDRSVVVDLLTRLMWHGLEAAFST